MWIACTHHRTTILENLDIIDGGEPAQLLMFVSPDIHHVLQVPQFHSRNRQVMLGGKAEHPANTGLGAGYDQIARIHLAGRSIAEQCRVIIVKDECMSIAGIAPTGRTEGPDRKSTR